MFAGSGGPHDGYQSVVFQINVDFSTTDLIRPYADISEMSVIRDEDEVLFFMGFVWKIESVEEMSTNGWYIVLKSCTTDDSQLITYIEESRRASTYFTIGNILRELGDHANADNFYQLMLEDENLTDEVRGQVYYNMAMLADEQGQHKQAKKHFQEAEKLIKSTPASNNSVLAPPRPLFAHTNFLSRSQLLSNIGRSYLKQQEYELAAKNFDAALQALQDLQEPSVAIERAAMLNNYGLLKWNCEELDAAHDYFNQAVDLAENDASSNEYMRNRDIVLKHITSRNNRTNV